MQSSSADDATPSAADEAELRAMAESLGLVSQRRRDPRLAPDVNETLLRALARRELTSEAARTLQSMIDSYEPWSEAYRRILRDEASRRNAPPPQ